MSIPMYKYTRLVWHRQIRLLKLHSAASPDDPEVSFDLVPILLDAAPPFEALSYAWGNPLPKCEVLCSGHRAEIGPSLYSALFHLRRLQPPGKSLWIWADAICINQNDTAERESQVRMMGDIYAMATFTVIWLGGEDDYITRAFDRLAAFETTWVSFMGSPEFHNITGPRSPPEWHEIQAGLSENGYSKAWDILQTVFGDRLTRDKAYEDIWLLLCRPWFMRKWVIQEVAKSKRLVFVAGDRSMPYEWFNYWFTFLEATAFSKTEFLVSYPWGLDLNANDDTNAHHLLARGGILSQSPSVSGLPLSYILTATPMFKCSEPNDHIIALLGIAADCSEFEDLIDYNISTDDLYRRLTCAYLTNSVNLRVLWSTNNMVPVDQRRTSSWIPNLEEMASRSAVSHICNTSNDWQRRMGKACGSTEIQVTTSGNKLFIRGRLVDVFAQSGTDMTMSFPELQTPYSREFTAANQKKLGVWASWLDECLAIAEAAGYDERGFTDSMLIEVFFENKPVELIVAAKRNLSTYRRIQKTLAAATDETTWIEGLQSMDREIKDSWSIIEGAIWQMQFRRFGRTRNNRMGWMPLVVDEGDYICVFDGMELPYVVRPRQGSGGNYVLVGDCFVPSLMNGEAMELPGVESVIITLE